MTETWGLLRLNEIDSINTQSVWHAAALVREELPWDNLLLIDWPNKPFVSVGYHQDPNVEVDLKYCSEHNYPVYRRSCGGGQVFLDGQQVFYHPITDPNNKSLGSNVADFYRILLVPVVQTYNDFGVKAEYSPINDIVAGSKKVSGNGAATLGNSRILTGNFIFNFPAQEMSKILRVPDEKFRDKVAKSLEERMGSFQTITGSMPAFNDLVNKYLENFQSSLNIELESVSVPQVLTDKMKELNDLYRTDEWKYELTNKSNTLRTVKIKGSVFVAESMTKAPGGLLKGVFVFDNNQVTDVTLTGDVSVDPMDGLLLLEKRLKGLTVEKQGLEQKVAGLLTDLDMPGVAPSDISTLILQAALSHKEASLL